MTIAVPLVICVYVVGSLFGFAISRDREIKVGQSLYYVAGTQYLLTGIFAWFSYVLDWSSWEIAEEIKSDFWIFKLIVLVLLPAIWIALIANSAVSVPARRGRRFYFIRLASVALAASAATASLLLVCGQIASVVNADLRSRALLKISFIDVEFVENSSLYTFKRPVGAKQWMKSEGIVVPIIVTNQNASNLILSAAPVWLTLEPDYEEGHSGPTKWSGKIHSQHNKENFISINAGDSVILTFEGKLESEVGLTDHAKGRLEVLRALPDGVLEKVTTHDWNDN